MQRLNTAAGAIAALSALNNAFGKLGEAARAAGYTLSNAFSAMASIPGARRGKVRHSWSNGHHGVHRKRYSPRKKAKAKARRRRMRAA